MINSSNLSKITDVAATLSLTSRRVQQLAKKSILPSPSTRGQYDLPACIKAYEEYMGTRSSYNTKKHSDLDTEKLRLLKAKADKAEFEFAVSQGEYITLEEVKYLWSGLLLTFRSKMLAMPSKLAARIFANCNDVSAVQELLQSEIDEALLELAKHDYVNDSDTPPEENRALSNDRKNQAATSA